MLGVIDVQPTFMPGGELPVAGGDAVVPAINQLLTTIFARAFATQDWHPPGHVSFASSHPGRAPFDEIDMPYGRQTLWPDHALQASANAALHPDLDVRPIELVIRKGTRTNIDSYSAFRENDGVTPTGLAGALGEFGTRRVFFCGLALDYCVASSAIHAAALGLESFVISDASAAIGAKDTIVARLARAGVRVVSTTDLAW